MTHTNSTESQTHAVLQRIRALRGRRTRDTQQALVLEGPRHFVQACDAGLDLQAIVYCPALLVGNLVELLVRRKRQAGTPAFKISPEQFRTVQSAGRASGIAAIAKQRWTPLTSLDPNRGLCTLIVEQIRSAGNLGTILRAAEAVGVGGLICVGSESDPFDPTCVRSAMGGLFHLPLVRTTPPLAADWLRERGVTCVGLSPVGEAVWTAPLPSPLAIAVGEERQGLSAELQAFCTTFVRLPMCGRADSLNVGIAAGVMLYELVRRREMNSR